MKITRFRSAVRRFAACQQGSGLVELGLVSALLTVTILGVIEFAAVTSQSIRLSNAARAAAEYAVDNPLDITGITNVAIRSGDLTPQTLTVVSSQLCECPGEGGVSCSNACSDGSVNDMYVAVDLAQPAETFLSDASLLPPMTLNRSATLRVR